MKKYILLIVSGMHFSLHAQDIPVSISKPIIVNENGEGRYFEDGAKVEEIFLLSDGKHYSICNEYLLRILPDFANVHRKAPCTMEAGRWMIPGADGTTVQGIKKNKKNFCGFDYFDATPQQIFTKDTGSIFVQKILSKICSTNGNLRQNFRLMQAPVYTACALYDNQTRYILYDEKYLHDVIKKTHSKWTAYFILAHEIAHHLNGDVLDSVSNNVRKSYETDADTWAGYAMHMLGAPRHQTLKWVRKKAFKDILDTAYYPNQQARINAVKKGWNSLYEVPETIKNCISVGLTANASAQYNNNGNAGFDGTQIQSADVLFHPPFGGPRLNDFLSHFAAGISYIINYDISFTGKTTLQKKGAGWEPYDTSVKYSLSSHEHLPDRFLITAFKYYYHPYFKNNFNGSFAINLGTEIQQVKVAVNYLSFWQKLDIEAFVAPTLINLIQPNDGQALKLLFGISAHYCSINYNKRVQG